MLYLKQSTTEPILLQKIEKSLKYYYSLLDGFHPDNTEFHYFQALATREFLEINKSVMSEAQRLMLCIVDKKSIEIYKQVKDGKYNDFGDTSHALQTPDTIDLKKCVLLARKNLKNNPLESLASKVLNLSEEDLLYDSCITRISEFH